jgi:hypothetical protein
VLGSLRTTPNASTKETPAFWSTVLWWSNPLKRIESYSYNCWWRLFGPIFHDAPPDLIDLIRSSNHMSDTRNLKTGECQSCEQLVDVDEPHAEQMNPTSNSMVNSEPHAEAR